MGLQGLGLDKRGEKDGGDDRKAARKGHGVLSVGKSVG